MAERKAVNKYYPPDWDPAKQGSVNKRVGQHPLRDRARKLSQGILVIRFELPYNIWCDGCNNHVGMGVRYNAEKKKVGNYYSTPIYKFRMKCHLCDNYFEIQTDPKNHDYVVVCGARRKEQRWDPAENEQIVTDDKAMQKKLAMDAMFKLEHGSDDQQKSKLSRPSLGLLEHTRGQWKDDYMLNRLARSKFRSEKKKIKAKEDADKGLLAKSSLEIPLVEETKEDIQLAGLLKYRTTESFDEKQQQKRKQIQQRPLFTNPESSSVSPSSSSSGGSTSGTSHDKLQQQRQRMGLVSLVSSQSPSPFSESTKSARKTRQINLGLVKKGSSSSINSNVKNNGARTLSVVESKDLTKTGTTCDMKDLDVGDDDPKHSGSDNPATERKNALNFLMSHYGNSDGSEGSSDD